MASPRDQWAKFAQEKRAGGKSPGSVDPVPETFHRARPSDLEFKIQSGFIDWVRIVEIAQIPELRLLYAIPNGGHRHPSVGGKMKREGVARGIPDMHLPIARGGYFSLYLETKAPEYRNRKNGGLSKWQVEKKDLLEAENNLVTVCYAIDELINAVTKYLAMPPTETRGQG